MVIEKKYKVEAKVVLLLTQESDPRPSSWSGELINPSLELKEYLKQSFIGFCSTNIGEIIISSSDEVWFTFEGTGEFKPFK